MNSVNRAEHSNLAIVSYPLTNRYKSLFEQGFPSRFTTYKTVQQLIRLNPFALIRNLRAEQWHTCFLPNEDAKGRALLPVLSVLALISGAKQVMIVNSEGIGTPLSFGRILLSLVGFGTASIHGFLCFVFIWFQTHKLIFQERIQLPFKSFERMLYIKLNFSFGVTAGGSVGHVAGVINEYVRTGTKVKYASLDKAIMLAKTVKEEPLPLPVTFGVPIELNLYRTQLTSNSRLSLACQEFKPTFIYQRLSVCNFTGVLLSRKYSLPLIIEYNGSEAWIRKNWGKKLLFHNLAVKMEDVCLSHAHIVVTISEALRDELITKGVARNRIVCYPNCIDPEVFDPNKYSQVGRDCLKTKWNIRLDKVIATFVGTFGEWHGVDVLALAVKRLIDQYGEEPWAQQLHFLFVGDGAKMPFVQDILKDPRYRSKVTFTGLVPQDEAPAYLAASDILLSPHVPNADGSRFFGSPTKLFEYMAMGKPIIASDLEQIGQVLDSSVKIWECDETPSHPIAVLVRPGNIEDILLSLKKIVTEPNLGIALGENARERVLARYLWAHHVQAIVEKCKNLTVIP